MVFTIFLFLFLAVLIASYWGGQRRVLAMVKQQDAARSLHMNHFGLRALPRFYGQRLVMLIGVPVLVLWGAWLIAQRYVVNFVIASNLPDRFADSSPGEVLHVISGIKRQATGTAESAALAADLDPNLAPNLAPDLNPAIEAVRGVLWFGHTGVFLVLILLMLGLLAWGLYTTKPQGTARQDSEAWNTGLMFTASSVAILITIGIVFSLLFQAYSFFTNYPVWDFLTGLRWSPGGAFTRGFGEETTGGVFGVVPLMVGTGLIATLAMMVAIPVGLYSAIYLSEYAGPRARNIFKPVLEILAGIPTVVYGLFAALTFTPWVASAVEGLNWLLNLGPLKALHGGIQLTTGADIALAAGMVMGTMIIPFIASFADDAIQAVPRSLRDGALGMGSTRSEMVRRVVLPAALPGIAGGILLAVSRAIGETMIVVMAAGSFAYLTLNPLGSVTTFTVQINTLLTGDYDFGGVKVQAAFAIGLFLFLLTLVLNTIALYIVRHYREEYD